MWRRVEEEGGGGVWGISGMQFHSLNSAFFRVSSEFSPDTLGSCGAVPPAPSPSHLLQPAAALKHIQALLRPQLSSGNTDFIFFVTAFSG